MSSEVKEYVKAVKMMLKMKGIDVTDYANHRALETGLINQKQFSAAASVIAEVILNA